MPDTTKTVVVSLPLATLSVGAAIQAVATITTAVPDSSLDTKPVTWTSSAPAIASVDINGLVRGIATGSATIKATVDGVVGQATLTVAMQVINISDALALEISNVPIGSKFMFHSPTVGDYICQVSG